MRRRTTGSRSGRDPGGTYWILAGEQIRCLTSARRQDILDRLAAAGPCSVREFAGSVGLAPSAIYHHLRKLERVGLVREAGTRVVHRRSEKLYAAAAPRMRLARAIDRAPKASMIRVVSALCRQMDRDFARGIGREDARAGGADRNLGFFRLVGSPDRRTLGAINGHLDAISELLWSSAGGKAPLLALGWTLAPVGKPARNRTERRRPA